jgi:hypothetical protein
MSKFIYIIDQKTERYETRYKNTFVNLSDYPFVRFIHSVNDLPAIETIVREAACVCLHTTFPFKDKDGAMLYDKDGMETALSEQKIPYILFTNKDDQAAILNTKKLEVLITSDTFYENIKTVLEDFEKTGTIDLEKMVYGKFVKKAKALQINTKIQHFLLNIAEKKPINLINGKRDELSNLIWDFGKINNIDTMPLIKRLLDKELNADDLENWLATELLFIE